MISLLALGVAVTFARPQHAPLAPDVRIIRARDRAHRYVRLRQDVDVDGVRGTETSLLDLATGRFAEHLSAGPLSSGDGFDGTRAWSTDATGMATVEGNAQARLDSLAWAHFFGRGGPERPVVTTQRSARGDVVVHLRYAELSAPIDVTLDRRTGLVSAIQDDSGGEAMHARYSDYRRVHDVVVPFGHEIRTRFGALHERVRSVELVETVPGGAFDPPPPPHDTTLAGTTSIAFAFRRGHAIVPVRINDGPVLHMLFDTGASNDVSPSVARRLGLRVVGAGKAGGFGPGVVARRYTTAKRLRIGGAELREQPFSVIASDLDGLDGTIGCEVMQRFAVRFSVRRKRIDLATDARAFGVRTAPIPMRLAGCQPEIDGALDGMRGAFAIDTGDANALLVMAPFVKTHKLLARYGGRELVVTGAVAGSAAAIRARAVSLRLGPVVMHDVPLELSIMSRGAANDPTQLGNVGIEILGKFDEVFDYRSGRMWLVR